MPRLDTQDSDALKAFIAANTKVLAPPLVPEILLHLAEESLPIWQKTEEELCQQNIPPPYWAFAWAGGQALARYLLDHIDIVAGKHVIDIGTGSGLTAIAAKLAGADTVQATDIDPFSIFATELNAVLNDAEIAVALEDVLEGQPPSCEVIILADVFYERQLADRALAFCRAAKAQGACILIGDPKRNYFPATEFSCLATYDVAVTRELEDAMIKKTSVWQL